MKNMKALKHEAGIKSFPVHDFMNFMVSMVDIFFPAGIFFGEVAGTHWQAIKVILK